MDGRDAVAGTVIVGFGLGTSEVDRNAVVAAVATSPLAGQMILSPLGIDAWRISYSGTGTVEQVAALFLADPRVRYAQPDYVVLPSRW